MKMVDLLIWIHIIMVVSKKYQWVTVPLAIHGVVAKKDGTIVDINIGEDDNDPVFCVTDLLIHLAQEQMQKKNAAKVIEGENLDILVGSIPLDGAEKDAVKAKCFKNSWQKNTVSKKKISSLLNLK